MEQILTAISVVSTICAIVFGYAAFSRNRTKDTEDEVKWTQRFCLKSAISKAALMILRQNSANSERQIPNLCRG